MIISLVLMSNRACAGGLSVSPTAISTATLTGGLDVKAEMKHIAINDFIVASFDA
jgi:hypothetical protein